MSEPATLASHGGKGLNLDRLTRAGLPVPRWRVLGTEAYRNFVTTNGLAPVIAGALAAAEPDDPAALERASATIRAAFATGTIPEPVAGDLQELAYDWGDNPLAVRSSATAEDLPDLSFAGQQDTFLNVIGAAELRRAVIDCWSSLWTGRAIGYRLRSGIDSADVALAVVIQELVDARASGVLFTANPLTGVRHETVIDATFGLGEALVSGQVEPDHFVINSRTGAITDRLLGAKATLSARDPNGGITATANPEPQRWSLTDAELAELTALGAKVQALYGEPQDVEWAIGTDGALHLLQARAITSLFPLPAFTPTADTPLAVWFSIGAFQGLVGPLTPLGQDALRLAFSGAASLFGARLDALTTQWVAPAGERLWARLDWVLRTPVGHRLLPALFGMVEPGSVAVIKDLADDPRLPPRPTGNPLSALARLITKAGWRVPRSLLDPAGQRASFEAATTALIEAAQVGEASAAALPDTDARLAARVANLRTHGPATMAQLLPRFGPIMAPGILLIRRLDELAAAAGDRSLGLATIRALPGNVTTQMNLELWRIATVIAADADAAAAFDAEPAELADRYRTGTLPPVAQRAVAGFLETYGMRGVGEIDLGRPRWREEPEQVFGTLHSYLKIDDPAQAPDAVFAAGRAAAGPATETLARRLGGLRGAQVRFAVSRVRAMMGARETPKFTIIRVFGVLRTGLLASGADLVTQGVLDRADDIFFLHLDELEQPARATQWRGLVAERRETDRRESRRRQVPRLLMSDGRAVYEGVADAGDGTLAGSPVSPGVVEGLVRVVLEPLNANLQPGEIMVCQGTDPAWTPLFLAAGGLITEVGGMMTHGSVVAREYGIPAVVGVGDATTRLTTGQRIILDGTNGVVRLVE